MSNIAVVSASLGGFDAQREHAKQSVDCDFYHFTDENFLPRRNSMTPRLQARIPKMTSWQMVPGYNCYLWVDSSCRLADKDSVMWFLEQLGDADIAVFKHPHRNTVQEEADYLKHRLAIKCPYITPRYENERIDEAVGAGDSHDPLYASTAFIYRDSPKMREALLVWWTLTSLYHSIDQLALPYALKVAGVDVHVIQGNYLKCKALEYVRNKK